MTLEPADARFLDERQGYSLGDIVSMSGLSPADLRELVDCGALVPDNPAAPQWSFSAWARVDLPLPERPVKNTTTPFSSGWSESITAAISSG